MMKTGHTSLTLLVTLTLKETLVKLYKKYDSAERIIDELTLLDCKMSEQLNCITGDDIPGFRG